IAVAPGDTVDQDAQRAVQRSSDRAPDAYSDVARIVVPGDAGKQYEYSRPTDILVADNEITGQVDYRVLTDRASDAKVAPAQVSFQTVRGYPNDALGAELIALLDRSGVTW